MHVVLFGHSNTPTAGLFDMARDSFDTRVDPSRYVAWSKCGTTISLRKVSFNSFFGTQSPLLNLSGIDRRGKPSREMSFSRSLVVKFPFIIHFKFKSVVFRVAPLLIRDARRFLKCLIAVSTSASSSCSSLLLDSSLFVIASNANGAVCGSRWSVSFGAPRLLLEQKCMIDPDTGHLAPTESHERDNPGIEDLNVLFSALSEDEESSVTRENSSMFPRRERRETAFFEELRHGERMVMIGAWSGLLLIILKKSSRDGMLKLRPSEVKSEREFILSRNQSQDFASRSESINIGCMSEL